MSLQMGLLLLNQCLVILVDAGKEGNSLAIGSFWQGARLQQLDPLQLHIGIIIRNLGQVSMQHSPSLLVRVGFKPPGDRWKVSCHENTTVLPFYHYRVLLSCCSCLLFLDQIGSQ